MKKGFTLVEIMIVILIIALLAALAIPLIVRNRMTAYETMAMASCRRITVACQNYFDEVFPHTYPPDLNTLGGTVSTPPYIDDVLASGQKSGYRFIYTMVSPVSFTLFAEPSGPLSGERYFYADQTGRITAKKSSRAGPGDPPAS